MCLSLDLVDSYVTVLHGAACFYNLIWYAATGWIWPVERMSCQALRWLLLRGLGTSGIIVSLVLLQADLAALWHGLDALLQWQAVAAAQAAAGGYSVEVPAVQTAFLLDLGVRANLQHVTQVLPHACWVMATAGCLISSSCQEACTAQRTPMDALHVSLTRALGAPRDLCAAVAKTQHAGVMQKACPCRAWEWTCRRAMQRHSQQTWTQYVRLA